MRDPISKLGIFSSNRRKFQIGLTVLFLAAGTCVFNFERLRQWFAQREELQKVKATAILVTPEFDNQEIISVQNLPQELQAIGRNFEITNYFRLSNPKPMSPITKGQFAVASKEGYLVQFAKATGFHCRLLAGPPSTTYSWKRMGFSKLENLSRVEFLSNSYAIINETSHFPDNSCEVRLYIYVMELDKSPNSTINPRVHPVLPPFMSQTMRRIQSPIK